MSDTRNSPPAAEAHSPPGLPPVAPPSGKFIVQQFLVPGLMVAAGVLVWLVVGSFFDKTYSPEKYMNDLTHSNPEVRWRAADALAKVLPENPKLTTDVKFALDLNDLLGRTLEQNRVQEKVHEELKKQGKEMTKGEAKALRGERDYILYLVGCLGHFSVPVGAPLLQELAVDTSGADAEYVFRLRSNALNALTVLGNGVKKVTSDPENERAKLQSILANLRTASEAGGDRGRLAGEALRFLEDRAAGRAPSTLKVGDTLIRLTADSSVFLRKQAASALVHWDTETADEVLVGLARSPRVDEDTSVHEEEVERLRKAHPEEARRTDEKELSYTAALALALRGSPRAGEILDVYEEMLDPVRQQAIWTSPVKPGAGFAETRSADIIRSTLTALSRLRDRSPDFKLNVAVLEPLVRHENQRIRTAALELQQKLQ